MRTRTKKQESTPDPQKKIRRCLLCKREFSSDWVGNRVCPKCKGKAAWKQGL